MSDPNSRPAGPQMSDEAATAEAERILRATYGPAPTKPTSYRDDRPLPVTGDSPPVPQPGRPPMSPKATDDSVRMLAFGGMTLLTSGGVSVVMLASEFANPTVIGMICAAPAAIAIPILALARLLRSAKEAEPAEIHNHYNGTVIQDQRSISTQTRGVIANTRNQMPH